MNELKFKELVDSYALANNEKNDLDKICKKKNAEIKSYMADNNLSDFKGTSYTVKYSVSKSETMDEDKLLNIFYNHNITENEQLADIIKTKAYIDFDRLESAIYNGLIPNDILSEMAGCTVVKETPRVIIQKNKE